LLLQTVFDEGPISRADLARTTELGRSTVSEITADLIGEGLVVEIGQGSSTGGKPPTLVELDPDGRFAVAVDLSTRPLEGALLNLRGRIVARATGKTLSPSGRDALEEVHRVVGELVASAKAPALGIGLGVPGSVDGAGRVVGSEQLGWADLVLRDELEEVYGFPVYIAADAEVAAVAEFGRSGLGPDANMLYVKVDDRVAVGVITEGSLHRTPRHGGDLTHMQIGSAGEGCGCGRQGCLAVQVSVARLLGSDAADISTEARRRLAADSKPDAHAAALLLGTAVAPVVATLDIDRVVIGGQFGEWEEVPEMVAVGIERTLGWSPTVAASHLGASAVLLGAAGMVLSGELGVVWG
jgi:predicted NBD/HSP70 family sugar kinase